MKRACVIGWPVEHSRSPLIHNYWLDRYGIEGAYTKEAVAPDSLAGFLRALAERGFAGCNVTVPHKEAAFALAERRDASAMAVAAANTLWIESGRLWAANTDSYGFVTSLDAKAPHWRESGAPVAVLGAGGAARAIVWGRLDAGARTVRVFNRTCERAQALAADFGEKVSAYPWAEREAQSGDVGLVVHATSLGLTNAGDMPMSVAQLSPACIVADIVYVPLETPFLRAARTRGLAVVDGLGMLLYQAVPGFERWFGIRPEVTAELYDLVAADIARASC